MIAVFALVLVLVVSGFIIAPLFRTTGEDLAESPTLGQELWTREKDVAVLAITEADFDRATGKLSDDDYRVLRSDYEGRALQAMDEMEKQAPAVDTEPIRYCAGCGVPLAATDTFCGSCGRRRFAA